MVLVSISKNDENLLAQKSLIKKIRPLKKEIKKILFIRPLEVHETKLDIKIAFNKRCYMYPPYGLGILNSILKKNNFNSKILDLHFEILQFIQNNPNAEIEDLTNKWRLSLNKLLKDFNPDLVALSCTFTMNHENMIEVFRDVKEFDKSIITVAGGVHVSNATKLVLKDCNDIDVANTHEGEKSFLNFIKFVNGDREIELSQISFLQNNKYYIIDNKTYPDGGDLNHIPDFDGLDLSKLTDLGEIGTFRSWRPKNAKGSAILANKGCRARCSFCSVRNFNGKGVRVKSIETIISEVKGLKENYGISHITWLDDDLFYDVDRTLNLYNEIVKQNLNITWDASNGIIASAAVAHPELISAAEESGCIGAYFGIESGNDKILADIHKPSGVKHYLKLGPLMNKHPKIFTRGFLMIGFPNENLSQIQDTINVAQKMSLDWYTVQLLTPLPNTEIYDQMVEAGKAKKNELNLDGDGFTMFSIRESERQRKIEEKNKRTNNDYINLLNSNKDYIPSQKELNDLWFLTDYEINYKPIFTQKNIDKLHKLEIFLTDVSDRMTRHNPLSNYFLSIVKDKLGKKEESIKRKKIALNNIEKSDYWEKRFKVLDIIL